MPSKISIEYFPAAIADLEEILNYIAKDNKDAAIQILNDFDTSITQLEQNPLLGIIPKHKALLKLGFRELSVKNYTVYFVLKENRIEVRAIIHGWRTWENYAKRAQSLSDEGWITHEEGMKRLKKRFSE